MWQSQQGTANADHPWNLWKSSQQQEWKEVALLSLPRPPCFFAHIQTVQECESPVSLGWQETCVFTPWWQCGRWGACQLQNGLWVSQPYLRQREDSGEAAAAQVQISAGFTLLPKCLVVDGWTLVLLDWQVWLTRATGDKGGGRQSEAHLLSWDSWLLLTGRSVFGRLSWATPLCQGQGHTSGTPCPSPATAGSACKAALAQGNSHSLCPVVQFQELQLVPPKRSGVIYPSEGIWSWFEDLRSWKITIFLSSLFEWWFLSLLD